MRPATVLKINRRTILDTQTYSEAVGQLVISLAIIATYSLIIEA